MSDKRIIEEPASEEIFHDDWLVKDSPLNETTKIQASVFMALVADEAKDGMVPYAMLATEWTALTLYRKDQVVIYNGELYRAKDTNVSPTFNPSAWTKISFDTLYRTTLADVKNSICEEWSTSGEYTLNDCAIHDDKLYKCVADTATVGTWVSNEWEPVSIYEIIQNLPKSASDVTYDNTESGLESENVQDALDEVAETITELSNTTEVTGTASGAIATFTDGADAPLKELKVAVTPYQDLHGYDGPWAGGAGKNKYSILIGADNWNGNADGSATDDNGTLVVTCTAENNSGAYSKLSANIYDLIGQYSSDVTYSFDIKSNSSGNILIGYTDVGRKEINVTTSWQRVNISATAIGSNKAFVIYNKSGSAMEIQVKNFMFEIGSVAHPYEPYSNICPIIGWDEAVVTRCGKNLLELSPATQTVNGVTFTVNDDGTISLSGTATQNTNYFLSAGERSFINGSFVLSGCPSGGGISTYYLRIDSATGGAIAVDYGDGKQFTISDGKIYSVYINVKSGVNTNGLVFKPMVELSTTATTYSPYNGATYTIDLDGTRYGGTLDATNGVMTVDRAYVDLGSPTWGYTNNRFYFNPTNAKVHTQQEIANLLCSQYPTNKYSNQADNSISSYAGYIYVRADLYSGDTTAFKTAVTGQQLVYELATPLTVQLSPTQVKSLEGENNISANCGNINNVEYVRNLNITINDLLSRING